MKAKLPRWVGLSGVLGLLRVGCALGATWLQDPQSTGRPELTASAGGSRPSLPLQVDGLFPELALPAVLPAPVAEQGISALVTWADRLWAVGYSESGPEGRGLFEINPQLQLSKNPASLPEPGRHGNRWVHPESAQAFIGPYVIDARGAVRVIDGLKDQPLAATARHLTQPSTWVYHLTASGSLFETHVGSLETRKLAELTDVLKLPPGAGLNVTAACTAQKRLIVTVDSVHGKDQVATRSTGRLLQWDGSAWSVVRENAFLDVNAPVEPGTPSEVPLYAVGRDKASTLLEVLDQGIWWRYRLPRGGTGPNRGTSFESMTVRPIHQGQVLLDSAGLFFDLAGTGPAAETWTVSPIARHSRSRPDLTFWRGLLVLAGQPEDGALGLSQPNFWWLNPEKLGLCGKPQGWGAVWWDDLVDEKSVSDPFLMTGFDQKVLHLTHDGKDVASFTIEVDFLGTGTWKTYASIQVFPGVYAHHEFPQGYSAHWVRLKCDTPGRATAMFIYR